GAPLDELAAEPTLHPADPGGQRGLRDAEPAGGPGEVQLLGERREGAQLLHLEVHSTVGSRFTRLVEGPNGDSPLLRGSDEGSPGPGDHPATGRPGSSRTRAGPRAPTRTAHPVLRSG